MAKDWIRAAAEEVEARWSREKGVDMADDVARIIREHFRKSWEEAWAKFKPTKPSDQSGHVKAQPAADSLRGER